jgi:hypothetical protein
MRRLTLLLALVACGDDGNRHIIDAPNGGDSPDGTGPAPVTLTVINGPTPTAGVRVYFQGPDSTLISSTTTDTTGTATAVMPDGGFVTALDPRGGGTATDTHLYTWAGVKSGDHLQWYLAMPTQIAMTVIVPTDGAHTNATNYNVITSCGSVTIPLGAVASFPPQLQKLQVGFDACASGDVQVVLTDPQQAQLPVSSFFAGTQTFADGGTLDLRGISAYTAAANRSYTFTNNPTPAANINVQDVYLTTRGTLYHRGFTQPGDVGTGMMQMPVTFTGALQLVVTDQATSTTDRGFAEWQAPGDYTTNFGSHLLPDFAAAPTLDATRKYAWAETAGVQTADFAKIQFASARGNNTWLWDAIGPDTGAGVQLPTVPTDVFDFNFAAGDPLNNPNVTLFKVPGGYDAARPVLFAIASPFDLVSGATGIISASQYLAQPQAFR